MKIEITPITLRNCQKCLDTGEFKYKSKLQTLEGNHLHFIKPCLECHAWKTLKKYKFDYDN